VDDGGGEDGVSREVSWDLFMTELGKLLVGVGAVIVVAGIVLMLLGRTNLPLGRLPGDFLYRGKNTTIYFPLATSVVVSVALSILLYVVSRWRR
jgi:hypothetical protein